MPLDVLSSVLHDLRVEGGVFARFEARGRWGIHYPQAPGAVFHLITAGGCQLHLLSASGAEAADPFDLASGDFVVLPQGDAHVLRRGRAPAVTVADALRGADAASAVPLGQDDDPTSGGAAERGAGATRYVCGNFRLSGRRTHPVIAALPPVLVVRGAAAEGAHGDNDGTLGPWLPVHLAAAACEAAAGRPGAEVVLARLSDVLFVHAIRAHLAAAPDGAGGWIGALRDPAVARALALLHAHPERAWTVAAIAREVAMSRSRFAARFTALVGRPPLGYLADWRMRRAEAWLADEGASVGEVAGRLGYRSEAAFSHAFRRRVGASPGALRRREVRKRAVA